MRLGRCQGGLVGNVRSLIGLGTGLQPERDGTGQGMTWWRKRAKDAHPHTGLPSADGASGAEFSRHDSWWCARFQGPDAVRDILLDLSMDCYGG
jgi:hypothetical protein